MVKKKLITQSTWWVFPTFIKFSIFILSPSSFAEDSANSPAATATGTVFKKDAPTLALNAATTATNPLPNPLAVSLPVTQPQQPQPQAQAQPQVPTQKAPTQQAQPKQAINTSNFSGQISLPTTSSQAVRLKDLLNIRGVRDNPIIGFGLVIGLKGTGDSASEITSKSMKKMLQSLGLNPTSEVTSKNVAAVVVTAKLPPFARQGTNIDVTVSSIGDAGSLANGHLIVTPLKAGDGKVYAVASGSVSLMGKVDQVKQQTIARIPQGAIVEKEMPLTFEDRNSLRLALNQPDFTTSARVARIINQELGGKFAVAKDPSTIDLIVPELYKRNLVELVGLVENFRVIPDQKARIVINEKTSTVVVGGDMVIKKVALAHQDMMISVGGEGANKDSKENKEKHVMQLGGSATVDELVQALNQMGSTSSDLIAIFQALIKDGALQAELEIL